MNIFEKIYSWTVSIQGTKEELEQVKYATYLLPNRRIVSTNAADNFARMVSGWGEFLLQAEAVMKNGDTKYAEL